MKTIIDKINSLKEKFPKAKIDDISGTEVTVTADMAYSDCRCGKDFN